MTGWVVLSPDQVTEVATEWRARRRRERPRVPAEDRPPVEVRTSDAGPDWRVEVAS